VTSLDTTAPILFHDVCFADDHQARASSISNKTSNLIFALLAEEQGLQC
jgi:hypothetical protein